MWSLLILTLSYRDGALVLVFFLPPTILVMRLCDHDRGNHNNACAGANKNTKINRIDEISKKSGMIPLEIVFEYQNIVLCWQRGSSSVKLLSFWMKFIYAKDTVSQVLA